MRKCVRIDIVIHYVSIYIWKRNCKCEERKLFSLMQTGFMCSLAGALTFIYAIITYTFTFTCYRYTREERFKKSYTSVHR